MSIFSVMQNEMNQVNDSCTEVVNSECDQINDVKYYRALLKGGHVSRRYYVEFYSYICAPTKKDAAMKCREVPRAKRNHKDFILALDEISSGEFCEGKINNVQDPYLLCKNKQDQDKILPLISNRIKPDPHFEETNNAKKKSPANKKKYRNHYVDLRENWIKDLNQYETFRV